MILSSQERAVFVAYCARQILSGQEMQKAFSQMEKSLGVSQVLLAREKQRVAAYTYVMEDLAKMETQTVGTEPPKPEVPSAT